MLENMCFFQSGTVIAMLQSKPVLYSLSRRMSNVNLAVAPLVAAQFFMACTTSRKHL